MMYALMLELPIFQGLSHTQLTSILEKVPFHFKKYKPNDYLIRVGEVSDKVVFLLSGRVRVITPTYCDAILIAEDFEAPHTMAFYNMFGKETTTRSSVYAQGSVGVMELGKEHFLQMIADNHLMLVNVLNILSSHAQKPHIILDAIGVTEPELRLGMWLLAYTSYNAKNVIIDASIKDWCSLLHVEGPAFNDAAKALADGGYIERQEGKLKLIDRYGLRTHISRNLAQN